MAQVIVLAEGYSNFDGPKTMKANCSCVLIISGNDKVIVDTMTAWDGPLIIKELKTLNIEPMEINWVINTHSHSDHVGNNNLFLNAKHLMGTSLSHKNEYYDNNIKSEGLVINENIKIVFTPGHTTDDISIVVTTKEGVIVISGDLFESEEDIDLPEKWVETGGSENPQLQAKNRSKVAQIADFIVPGHGKMFAITESKRKKLQEQENISFK